MARPFKQRRVCGLPTTSEFAPSESVSTESVEMTVDEYEVIRLIDHLKLTQNECAQQMDVARTTVQAIYDSARGKIAESIVDGKRLVIHGGNYLLCSESNFCCGKNCTKRRCLNDKCEKKNGGCLRCGQNRE